MKKLYFRILYVLAIVCWLMYPLGPVILGLTPRQLMAVVMFFVCLYEERTFWGDKYTKLYFVFFLFFGLSSIIGNRFEPFIRRFIGDFLVSIIVYWSTKILCQKYRSVNTLIYTLLIIGGFDAVVTTFQVFHIGWLNGVLGTLNLINTEDAIYEWIASDRDLIGVAIPGICSSSVVNGHLLMSTTILSMYLFRDKFRIWALSLLIILLVGLFFAQIRTPFFLSLIMAVYLLYKRIGRSRSYFKIFSGAAITIGLILLVPQAMRMLMSGSSRYAELGLNMTGRDVIYSQSVDYILTHPFGGYFHFVESTGMWPHNFFLSAFLCAGWIGALFIIAVIVIQLYEVIKRLFGKNSDSSYLMAVAGCTLIALISDGMFHNLSYVNGDILAWLFWAMFCFETVAEGRSQSEVTSGNDR